MKKSITLFVTLFSVMMLIPHNLNAHIIKIASEKNCTENKRDGDDNKKKKKGKKGDDETTITLVTDGEGRTKEDAVKNALRNALEQTFGVFVSSQSLIKNDELKSDEIVSISSGNIVEYEVLTHQEDKLNQVTVKSVVSISKLAQYAHNKGMATDFAGEAFGMKIKMDRLNIQNQDRALSHMINQVSLMARDLFDYKIKLSEPYTTPGGIQIDAVVEVIANKTTLAIYDLIHKTMSGLADSPDGKKMYWRIGCFAPTNPDNVNRYDITYALRCPDSNDQATQSIIYRPNDYHTYTCSVADAFWKIVFSNILKCKIVDNLGNMSCFGKTGDRYFNNYGEMYTPICLSGHNILSKDNWGNSDWGGARLVSVRPGVVNGYAGGYANYTLSYDHWMNRLKPKEGETLYRVENIYLHYSMDEIERITKIEILPYLPEIKDSRIKISIHGNSVSFIKQ